MKNSVLAIALMGFTCFGCKQDTSSIPELNIVTKEWINFDHYVHSFVDYKADDYSDRLDAYVKLRGGMSVRYEKKSISMKIGFPFPFNQDTNTEEWILNANYIDKTLMRHKLAYDLFQEMHPNNRAPSSSYIHLSRNGNYQGIYVLMQRLNTTTLSVDSTGFVFKEPEIFKTPEDVLEIKRQKFPKRTDSSVYHEMKQFQQFLFEADDAEFQNKISGLVDLQSAVDWYLLLLFSNNGDGVLKNVYLYKQSSQDKIRFAPWDYDHSWGRDGDNELNMNPGIDEHRSILLRRLNTMEEFQQLVKSRWHELRENQLFSLANFERHIQSNYAILKPEIQRNRDLWPDSSTWYFDNNSLEDEIQIMRSFVQLNIQHLDAHFDYVP